MDQDKQEKWTNRKQYGNGYSMYDQLKLTIDTLLWQYSVVSDEILIECGWIKADDWYAWQYHMAN